MNCPRHQDTKLGRAYDYQHQVYFNHCPKRDCGYFVCDFVGKTAPELKSKGKVRAK